MLLGSCPEFGVSGSGMVREWKRRINENGPNIDGIDEDPQYQHSFVGPLSMSKGCDLTVDYKQQSNRRSHLNSREGVPEFVYRGKMARCMEFGTYPSHHT